MSLSRKEVVRRQFDKSSPIRCHDCGTSQANGDEYLKHRRNGDCERIRKENREALDLEFAAKSIERGKTA